MHYYDHGRNGDIIVREPLILGHEAAGTVVELGSRVTGFEIGDRVALEVGLPCEHCELCTNGRYNLCKEMRFRSSAKGPLPHFQGTLQEKINHPARWCHKLPDRVDMDLGALLEPMSVAIHATRRANIPLAGAIILIFGAGAVGLLCAFIAKQAGAAWVVVADVEDRRLEFALKNGFVDDTQLLQRSPPEQSVEADLLQTKSAASSIGELRLPDKPGKETGGAIGEVNVTFECTGAESCLQTAIYATKPGGKVMLVGMGTPIQTLPISAAALREVDLCGVFRYADTYGEGIQILHNLDSQWLLRLRALMTYRSYGMEQAKEAFDMAAKAPSTDVEPILKILVHVGEEAEGNARTLKENGLT